MSWLEYLGLEYILSDGKGFGEGLSFGGLVFLVGGGCWLLLAIFNSALVDKGIVVFNLFIAILLLIITAVRYIKNISYTSKSKLNIRMVFYIISIVVIGISFVYGLNHTYHSLIFDYEYKGIYSGIASILYPLLILNLLFPFFCEKSKFGNKIQECTETIGLFLILTLICFCIGQVVTLGLSFSNEEQFYDKFIVYHDREVAKKRQSWEYSSVEDCINKLLPTEAQNLVNNSNTKSEKDKLKYIHEKYPQGDLKYNKVIPSQMKWEDDYIVVYAIKDKEYNNIYYVRFNYKDYTILGFVDKAYYENVKKSEQ